MPDSLETRLRAEAEARGFTLFGIAPATEADGFDRFTHWLDAGYAGELDYLHKYRDHRRHPRSVRPWVRSVVMLGLEYGSGVGSDGYRVSLPTIPDTRYPIPDPKAKVAAYATGPDYHRFIWDRVNDLSAWLMAAVPGCHAHGVADTAPILERDFARRAGLGWFGKNTMLINKHRGSFFFLAAFLTDLELTPSAPHDATHCGSCTACLDACPTQAFPEPGVLDARKCVSYLTIELRGPIPEELRSGVGDWLFGCDVCQEVCPWNRDRRDLTPRPPLRDGEGVLKRESSSRQPLSVVDPSPSPADTRTTRTGPHIEHPLSVPERGPVGEVFGFPANPALLALEPVELLGLSPAEFRTRFEGTSLLRARRSGLLRNAAIVLGNTGDAAAIPALERATEDADAVIAEAASWAITRIRERCG